MANAKRLIDANALDAAITVDYYEHFTQCHDTDQIALIDMVREDIGNAPTVEAVEVVHGHMVERIVDYEYPSYKVLDCSECGCSVEKWHNYCPNCGAKMDGERKDNEKETT